MRKEYNFSNSQKNPYPKKLKKQITIRIDSEAIEYFKEISSAMDIPYQNLINMYLKDCARKNLKPDINWVR